MLKNTVKKKQNQTQVSHFFKNSYMLKNMQKKLAKKKII